MAKHIREWAKENWTVGQYTPTNTFKEIMNHSCVCKPDLGLIAIVGPAEDLDSQRLADLYSQAPQLFLLLEDLFMNTRLEISPEMNNKIVETLKLARGNKND